MKQIPISLAPIKEAFYSYLDVSLVSETQQANEWKIFKKLLLEEYKKLATSDRNKS